MSESRRILDARGLACPEPVLLTRKALAQGGFTLLEVIVDDPAARENVLRSANHSQCPIQEVVDEGPVTRIVLRPAASAPGPAAAPAPEPLPEPGRGATLLLAAAGIGAGDEQLGALLMRTFLYTLTEREPPPARIILMNGGVRLAVAGSESLVNLRRLADLGVDILVCGTCLEYLGLKAELAVGRVSNMYEIADLLLDGRSLALS